MLPSASRISNDDQSHQSSVKSAGEIIHLIFSFSSFCPPDHLVAFESLNLLLFLRRFSRLFDILPLILLFHSCDAVPPIRRCDR